MERLHPEGSMFLVIEAVDLMLKKKVKRLPVLDGSGKLPFGAIFVQPEPEDATD